MTTRKELFNKLMSLYRDGALPANVRHQFTDWENGEDEYAVFRDGFSWKKNNSLYCLWDDGSDVRAIRH